MKMWMSLISLAVLLPLALGNSCLCDSRPVRRALMDLYVATGGAQWTNSSGWGTPSAVCAWYGISCVGDEFTVSLGHNNLVGTLPSSWGDASSIQRVFLEGNRLTGPLPESWGGMRGLRTLTLSENGLKRHPPGLVGQHDVPLLPPTKQQHPERCASTVVGAHEQVVGLVPQEQPLEWDSAGLVR